VIGLALFSTNISTIHLVSLAQEGYVNGLAYGNFEWMAAFLLIVLSFFFAPFYIRSRVATLPDFLERRYSRACRDWLAVLSILSAVFIHIGFSLYTGAVVLKGLFGIDINMSIIVTAALTGIYTIIGGLLAVVITESAQTIILI
jgi:SSS family solute:Na+ symporter